ncbi:AAA family ATPase [Bacillus sp. UNC438CL73TsuS30]|uniref:AAA family ATPase n=1 Tax=Bacillus sp. UNC438CL73TsuS30 TaxID=1340434 RepID=UPI00047CFC1C|nr:ATP-binding protein [Bacillus sp. UNC438CL73TsuS30]
MLLEFSVGNFLSFKNKVTFSMVASNLRGHEEDNVFSLSKIDLLKTAVIYGANASGKSNLFSSMSFMKNFILNSSKESQSNEKINVKEFKFSSDTLNKPSEFEIIFIHEEIPYRYGFIIDTEKVHREWLYYVPKTKEAKLFEREGQNISLGPYFDEGKGLDKKTRKNALFLSVVDQFNGEKAKKVMDWFDRFYVISGIRHDQYKRFTVEMLDNLEYKQEIVKFLKNADIGIEDISTIELSDEDLPAKMPKELKELVLSERIISTKHGVLDSEGNVIDFELMNMERDESEGTKKLFALSGPIIETLLKGETLVIDELDAKLHPLITRFILNLFQSTDKNPKNGQLIFATHDTNILSSRFFRRDQIWFTEKDKYSSTDLYSLAEYKMENDKKVRVDASFEKDYIQGKYGAVPYVGDFDMRINGGGNYGDR